MTTTDCNTHLCLVLNNYYFLNYSCYSTIDLIEMGLVFCDETWRWIAIGCLTYIIIIGLNRLIRWAKKEIQILLSPSPVVGGPTTVEIIFIIIGGIIMCLILSLCATNVRSREDDTHDDPVQALTLTGEDTEASEYDNGSLICVICMTNRIATVHRPCQHPVACLACARSLIARNQHQCPKCRAHVDSIDRLYL